MDYPKVLILWCALLGASQSLAHKTTRRFEGLPETGARINYNNAGENSRTMIIRHDLPGRIIFHESTEFWIELATTTPEGQNNSNVKALYTSIDNNTILLQVYKPTLPDPEEASESDKVLIIILSSVGAFVLLGLVVSALSYFCYWKKRQTGSTKTKETVHELSEGLRKSAPDTRHRFHGNKRSAAPGTSVATQLTIVAVCACALQAQLQLENVEINVYFPSGFLRPDTKVFLNSENNNEIRVMANDTKIKISIYDVPSAGLVSANHCPGRNVTCINGACDPIRGRCVCPRKMRVNRKEGSPARCVHKCNENCPSGFFELSPCNHTHPAVCKKCRPLCSFKEFESVPCAGKTNRNCTDISELPRIKVSSNIAHEDVLKVKDDPPVRKTITSFSSDSVTWLNRSSGLAIRLKMISVDFSTTFQEVKHDVNDNTKLPQSASSVLNYCSFPVPEYYEINLRREGRTVKYVKGDPGKACPSYDGVPSLTKIHGNLFSCNGAENVVVRLFGEDSVPDDFSKEESSRQCYDYKQNCNKCRDKCSNLARENPICNLTAKDVKRDGRQDYGEHFTYCFDCCFQENCTCPSCACSLYNATCIGSQVTCVEAERFSVPIQPVFPSSGKFKCHVEALQGPAFEIETAVWKDGELLKTIDNDKRNTSQEITGHDYGYMILKHPSVLRNDTATRTIMISGEAGKSEFDVGWYETEKELKPSSPSQKLFIQPEEPFKINSKDWPGENCQTLNTEKFVTISSSKTIRNFKKFPKLTAHLANEENIRVYKVYNNSGVRQVLVEMPQGRSVLGYAFSETVIYNDRSFTGHLIKNRTFWTIRVRGRVSSCPGFFVIRLTDQDRPDVDVYHYDVAITNEDCSFTIEFHLPSGGDTNMIDKQFVVRLADSRKTMKLILISPRRIPEFEVPDFDDDFDLKKLEVLLPFGGASGGMFIVLVAILIYGYKTRPKDSYQRDRDNELHFRHLLFVGWFVGMRLVKSFLLTLTVLSVILTAIHYKSVRTLQDYKAFHKHQKSLEEDFIKQMDSHRVQEINRQWGRLGEGKLVCDQKLQALNAHLEKHFKEMKEKQEEEMRRKSIILTAIRRIETQFNATKAKFERERNRLNEQMRAYSNEINSRMSKIENKIENNFWLKAARGMHKAFSGIARFFGKSMKPFIQWVGLSVSFPNINLEMPSFEDLFENVDFKIDSLNPSDLNSSSSFRQNQFTVDTKINIQQITVPELNTSSPLNKERAKELLALEWIVELYKSGVITTILLLLDILWFVYRHSRTYQFAVVLIHGFPKVYELEKIYEEGEKKKKKLKRKGEKMKRKAKKKAKREKEAEHSNDSEVDGHEDEQESTSDELDVIQEKEIKNNKERKRKEEDKMKKKTERKAKKKEGKSSNHNAVDLENTQGNVVDIEEEEIKENRGIEAAEYEKENDKQKERAKYIAETGKKKGQGDDKVENFDEGTKSEDSKEKKVIASSLKGLDTLNTVFLKFLVKLKELNYQINNTNLVPMCVLSVIAILSVYVVIVTAQHSMNVDTLDVVGYFDLKMAPILTMRKIVNTRITSNAFMVNEVHIPYYENRVNARIAFYRKKAEIYRAYQCAKADLHNEEYCSWAAELGKSCDGVKPYNEDFLSNLTRFECNLEPVLPQRFTKFDRILYKEVHKKAIAPYVAALRSLILDTFYMILVVIGISIILKILGMAVFVLLKKFDLVRQVKHYQTNQDLKKEMEKTTVPHCIKYPSSEMIGREIRPIKISESMKVKIGPLVREGKISKWVGHENER